MKKSLLFLLFILSLSANSQISVGSRHTGTSKKIDGKDLERFYKTKTIFLFSNIYDKSIYEEVLKNSWTVTPYEIVAIDDFNLYKYLDGSYSFASIGSQTITRQKKNNFNSTFLYCYFDFYMFDEKEKKEELEKLAKKSEKKIKNYNVLVANKINLARIYLYPKDDFIDKIYKESNENVSGALVNEDMFFNYKPGFLVNYFQKVNQLLKDKQTNWMYAKEAKSELANLRTATLYVPEYLANNYRAWKLRDDHKTEEEKVEFFSKYKYKYQYIDDDEVSKKILNNEEFYYLRYARTNSERFLQVINSKTGEIVYSDYMAGLSYQLKEGHIKDLSEKIKKIK